MVKAYEKKSLRRTLSRVRRDVRAGKKTKRASISKKDATIVLAQGVSAAPRRNFGTKNVSQCKNGESVRACIASLDARVPTTIGLPRAVGPYTVMRTSKLIGSSRDLIMFCPFYRSHSDATPNAHGWYSWCGVQSVNSALAVNDPHNTEPVTMPLSFLGAAAEVVPAAMTVQVMNPAAIQGADGIFAMARVNQQLDLGRTTTNWFDMKDRLFRFIHRVCCRLASLHCAA